MSKYYPHCGGSEFELGDKQIISTIPYEEVICASCKKGVASALVEFDDRVDIPMDDLHDAQWAPGVCE